MNAAFQLVHFVTDPFVDGRIPIAAIVRGTRERRLVRSAFVPDAHCIGLRNSALIGMVLKRLESDPAEERSRGAFGAHIFIDEPRFVPEGIADPVDWVRSFVLPLPPPVRKRGVRRATLGWTYLRRFNAANYVRKTFDRHAPLYGELVKPTVEGLRMVSQYVPGAAKWLLLEPVAPDRPDLAADIAEVASRFIGYQWAIDHHHVKAQPQLVAYVLDGGSRASRHEAIERLQESAHEVVDLADSTKREAFLHAIRDVGASRLQA